ncbi:MAG: DegT/DnrJ/EryC1/StrS family aminotransferase [Pseudomonadales bacterium]
MKIPLARSEISADEAAAIARVIDSGRLASGPEIAAFEEEFAIWLNVNAAVAMNSGTSALIAALRAVGVRPGDEVIVPALTFVATANAVLTCGARPVLVDVLPDSWNLDPGAVAPAIGEHTRAIIAVHLFGLVAPMGELQVLARKANVALVEDACEAIGSTYGSQPVGGLSDVGVFGFYPNKVLTTGEGGMVVSTDASVVERARAIANQGFGSSSRLLDGAIPGYSFRMNEFGAALGRAQLTSIDRRLSERERVAAKYVDALGSIAGLTMPVLDPGSRRGWFTFPMLLPREIDRARVMVVLDGVGIETADYFPALHNLTGYGDCCVQRSPLDTSEDIGRRLLCLPLWEGLDDRKIETVVVELCKAISY